MQLYKYLIITFILLLSNFKVIAAQQQILIYADTGAGLQSVANTLQMLQTLVANKYLIKTVNADEIMNTDWENNTVLLIIPGGADLPYVAKLSGIGNRKIKQYVSMGGKFLGICAGAYYAADKIEFYKGDPSLEITGERELKFFPGIVAGPTYIGFDERKKENIDGIRAAKVYLTKHNKIAISNLVLYYNGGGHFVAAERYQNVRPLAYHADKINGLEKGLAAIVECDVGNGKAILSGVHFEWAPENIDIIASPQLSIIKQHLMHNNEARLALARHLLSRLDVKLR